MDTRVQFPFSQFPRLATPRLSLREISTDDLMPLFRICSDRDWLKLWGQPAHRHVDDTRTMLQQIRRAYQDCSGLRWAITMKGRDELIGCVGFARIAWQHFRAEVTGELSHACSGKGIMAEGIRAVAQFGFDVLGLHSIEANVDPQHAMSIRICEKLGFVREGFFRENYFCDGRFYDTITFSLLSGRTSVRGVADAAGRSMDRATTAEYGLVAESSLA
jgi:RimJ/RimL family protein N-acetyltransferase